jgi:hypothetical protein
MQDLHFDWSFEAGLIVAETTVISCGQGKWKKVGPAKG